MQGYSATVLCDIDVEYITIYNIEYVHNFGVF